MCKLTVADVYALNEVIAAASECAKVAWVNGDGDINYGTARYVRYTDDVRQGDLRITTRSGMELWLGVADLVEMYHRDEFRRYDW